LSTLLSSSQLFSPHLSSSQLTLRSSQFLSGPKPAPKIESRRQIHKKIQKVWFWSFLKANLKGTWKAPKTSKVIKNKSTQLWRNHSNAICKQQVTKDHGTSWNYMRNSNIEQQWRRHHNAFASSELQKTMELRAQQKRRATLMQPFQYELASSELQKTIEVHAQRQRRATVTQPLQSNVGKTEASPGQSLLQNRISAPKPKKSMILKLFKTAFKRKMKGAKNDKHPQISLRNKHAFLRAFHQNTESWRCENETKLSCETTSPTNESWRCENEAFVRDVPQKLQAEDVKTKLSC